MKSTDRIAELCVELNKLVDDCSTSKLSILVETSEDEAVFLGTPDAYIRFVVEMLNSVSRCLEGNGENVTIGSVNVPFSSFGNSMNRDAHVVVRSVGVTNTDDENQLAAQTFMTI